MNDTASPPSRLLKITAVTARWLLGLLIAAWLLLALSVFVLHAVIVPRIGDYRGLLETQASRAVGVPVRIGAITAQSAGIFPAFELRDVVLLDAEQRVALRLSRVVASVSPRSLFRFSFEQLYVEGPQVEVRRDPAGKLHVAGLDVAGDASGETRGADWFFAQRELVIEGGTVRWTDERRGAEPLLLTDVRFVARNSGRRHAMRLDATPPTGWGQRFTLRGQFRQPLLSMRTGNWQTWNGEIYADLPVIDVTRLGRYVALDARIREGSGALRAWVDIAAGKPTGGAVDLGLARIDASLGKDLEPLVLRAVTGRVAGRLSGETLEFSTQALQFDTAEGLRWPGGNLWFQHTPATPQVPERGALRADRLDLAALVLIADRLPLGATTHRMLDAYAPRGLIESIDAGWQGSLGAPERYQLKGRVSGLSMASQPGTPAATSTMASTAASTAASVAKPRPPIGTPGLRGATFDFDATQAGGSGTLALQQGALDFPGVFEEPSIPIDRLAAQLAWKLDGAQSQLTVSGVRFANADAEGQAQATWRTSDPAVSRGGGRFPGVLDLTGQLTRAKGARVFRYLPLDIPKATRDYVRDAVTAGNASSVDFRVRGDLHDMPFMDPKQGEFRIAAKVSQVDYAYVPASTVARRAGSGAPLVWPPLQGVSGELVFERAGMAVRQARGRLVGAPGVEITQAEASIEDMSHHHPVLNVAAQARGPLDAMLRAGAPLTGEAGEVLSQMRATGTADYNLRFALPLEAPEKTQVQASIGLNGNELLLAPQAPSFSQVRGALNFTESGFSMAGLQAHLLGGDVRVTGRGSFGVAAASELTFSAEGVATAAGLQAVHGVPALASLATKMDGSAPYSATLAVRDGVPEFSLRSTLQGLALNLPAPLAKSAGEAMSLALEKKVLLRQPSSGSTPRQLQDELTLSLGQLGSAHYRRDISGPNARVLGGSIDVGVPEARTRGSNDAGVDANIQLARLDLQEWQSLLKSAGGPVANARAQPPVIDEIQAYLPTRIAVRAEALGFGSRTLHNVVLGGTREGTLWRANIDAKELSGYAEYRDSQAGRLYARLARLSVAPSEATEVESLLDEQPDALPALDIVIDDLQLMGRRFGRAEIEAVNRGGTGREWQLNKLAFTTPDASFTARGTWAAAGNGQAAQRRTAMRFQLQMADSGALLTRFGMPGLLRNGRGRLEGDITWQGSPLSLDYPSLDGQLALDVGAGQFLKADPGIAKLLGVLSLQALPRRLTLDFRDVFSQGFAFDFIRGNARIANGVASTNNLQMKGVNAAALLDGSADIVRETQDLRVVVVPEINAGTAALVATVINPAVGLGAFLAQWILGKPLAAAATQEFHIQGTWADPQIARVPRRLLQGVNPLGADRSKDTQP